MVFHRDQPFLRPAIESVLNQTFPDFELVLVDNGTGLSADALGHGGRDPRIRWVRLPRNLGIPAGHNAGVAAATGEFIALLDHDDLALPRRLEQQVAALKANPALGLVSSLAERIDESGRRIGREFSLVEAPAQRAYTQYAAPVVTPAYTGRREAFTTFPYRAAFPLCADFDFLARVAERWPMESVRQVLLRYRWHPLQTTQAKASAIEPGRCAVQIVTARRRAGRAEDIPSALAAVATSSAAEAWRRGAALCVHEGIGVLAAYQARKSLAGERTPRSFVTAFRLAAQAFQCGDATTRMLIAKMFFGGPVRALGLRPA
jgi:hypothetical protein